MFAGQPVEAACDEIAGGLNHRDDDDQDGDDADHDARVEALIAVTHGKVAQSSCTHGTGHGRGADHRDHGDGEAPDDAR